MNDALVASEADLEQGCQQYIEQLRGQKADS